MATAGNTEVALTWSSTAGASSYRVHRSTTSGGPYTTIAPSLTVSSHLDTGVVNGTTYHYVVSAVNQAGEGPDSNEVSATPQAPQPPAAPTGLKTTAGKRKATLSWSAVSGATSYRVKRSGTSGGPYTVVASSVTATTLGRLDGLSHPSSCAAGFNAVERALRGPIVGRKNHYGSKSKRRQVAAIL